MIRGWMPTNRTEHFGRSSTARECWRGGKTVSKVVSKALRAAIEELFDDYNLARRGWPSRLEPGQVSLIDTALRQIGWREYTIVRLLYLHALWWEAEQASFPDWPHCSLKELAAYFRISVDQVYAWRDRTAALLAADLHSLLPPGLVVLDDLPLGLIALERSLLSSHRPRGRDRRLRDDEGSPRTAYCERRFRAYYTDQASFRHFTRFRGELQLLGRDDLRGSLPDTPRQVIQVMSRREVLARAGEQPSDEIRRYRDRMLDMATLWERLSEAQRRFINWKWFESGSAPRLVEWFSRWERENPSQDAIPRSVRAVWRWRSAILRLAEETWLGDGEIPKAPSSYASPN